MKLLVTVQEGGQWLPALAFQEADVERRLDEHLQVVQPEMHVRLRLAVGLSTHHTLVHVAAVRFPDGRHWNSRAGWLDEDAQAIERFGHDVTRLAGMIVREQGPHP